MTDATAAVLAQLTAGVRYGYEILAETGLKSGTVYPILHRLEARGLVRSEWESIDPAAEGRPPRKLYRLVD